MTEWWLRVLLCLGLALQVLTETSPRSTVLEVCLETGRNRTGHWLTQVDLKDTAPQGVAEVKETGRFGVSVKHTQTSDLSKGEATMIIRTTITVPPLPPGSDYELFPGMGYYKVNTTAVVWSVAREICALEGTHLAIINSEEEAELIRQLLARYPTFEGATSREYAYIGYHDHDTEGQFVTVFGDPLSKAGYEQWHGAEPNRSSNNTEDCGLVHRDGKLADVTCGWLQPFICEQEL